MVFRGACIGNDKGKMPTQSLSVIWRRTVEHDGISARTLALCLPCSCIEGLPSRLTELHDAPDHSLQALKRAAARLRRAKPAACAADSTASGLCDPG